jgi:glycosyltransferase involved in cell wall biosynthesis
MSKLRFFSALAVKRPPPSSLGLSDMDRTGSAFHPAFPLHSDENLAASAVVRSPNKQVVVYYNGTFIHLRNGAHARMTSLLQYLVKAGYSITLFSFKNHPTEPWTEAAQAAFKAAFPNVRLVMDTQTAFLRCLTYIKNALTSFFPAKAHRIIAWRFRAASPNYESLATERSEAVWIVNYADGLTQLNGVPKVPIVVETHDIKFIQVAKKNCTPPFSLRSLLRMRSELGVLNCAAAIIAISSVEAGLFRATMADPRVFYIPRYASATPTCRVDRPKAGYLYDLIFVGSDMFQNARGLLTFFEANTTWLASLRVAVVGRVGENASVRAFAQDRPNIHLLGFVDDLFAIYAASKAAISPVEGTGLKIKAVEALGHGRPVFASRHSMEGLAPGYDRCVFPIERSFIERLLWDDSKLEAAQASALAYWESLATAGDITKFQDFLQRAASSAASLE